MVRVPDRDQPQVGRPHYVRQVVAVVVLVELARGVLVFLKRRRVVVINYYLDFSRSFIEKGTSLPDHVSVASSMLKFPTGWHTISMAPS